MEDKQYTATDIEILTDIEHVRKRTQIYLGSMTPIQYNIPLLINKNLEIHSVEFTPSVYKAVNEIIDNSLDEFSKINKRSKRLTIQATPSIGKYLIQDNGRGIPIEIHPKAGKYVPEVALGSLRSGRNFTDEKESGVIGQNGVGSACTNFCSEQFTVTVHRDSKRYYQTFSNGANQVAEPSITKEKSKDTGTQVEFQLDPLVFKDVGLPDQLIHNRAIEIAFNNPDVTVEYNGQEYHFRKGLGDIIDTIVEGKTYYVFDVDEPNVQGSIYVVFNATDNIDEQMFTWVNSSLLFDGGKCNTQFFNAFFDHVIAHLEKDAKKLKAEVTRNDVRQGLLVLATLKIKNPEYDGQNKLRLTGPDVRKEFNTMLDTNWRALTKTATNWLSEVLERAHERHHKQSNKKAIDDHSKKSRRKIDGLLDATSSDRAKCSLLICEGLCLDENTEIKIIENGIKNKRLKDVTLGDTVITHTGKLKPITNIVRTIKPGIQIRTQYGSIIGSPQHKLLTYNKVSKQFGWMNFHDINIDKNNIQLVRSKLGNFVGCSKFKKEQQNDPTFPYKLVTDIETMHSSSTHTWIVLDTDKLSIEEISCEDLDPDVHWLLLFDL